MQIRVCNVAFVAYIYKASVAYVLQVKPMWRDGYQDYGRWCVMRHVVLSMAKQTMRK